MVSDDEDVLHCHMKRVNFVSGNGANWHLLLIRNTWQFEAGSMMNEGISPLAACRNLAEPVAVTSLSQLHLFI